MIESLDCQDGAKSLSKKMGFDERSNPSENNNLAEFGEDQIRRGRTQKFNTSLDISVTSYLSQDSNL
jgi:hypothetical protein